MRRIRTGWLWLYGANPLHLLLLLAGCTLAGYAVSLAESAPMFSRMLVWFGAAVIVHDFVLFPVYALGDRFLTGGSRALRRSQRMRPPVSPVNYVRLPALGVGLLFILFYPGILERSSATYIAATGQTQEPFSHRWLLLTAVMFGAGVLAYAARLGYAFRHRSGARDTSRGRDHSPGRGPDSE
ncbi:hypothetical protein [Haloactinomyces albus]|uniref:Lipoprotein n=1 Tax=Haloactinomyces albus TaxID=1352928 RepID=A0AAE4CPF3_9ACTN|nr:hypothetical protein [Haloactinomyces albus]MDR7303057.1 hypothetical protein [Haloactinomyces albus]